MRHITSGRGRGIEYGSAKFRFSKECRVPMNRPLNHALSQIFTIEYVFSV